MQAGQAILRKRGEAALIWMTVAWLGGLAFVALAAPGAAFGSSEDREATQAYLAADYEYTRASVANAGASKADFEALATSIGSECAGVIMGASSSASHDSSFARRVGEEMRIDEQEGDLEDELSTELTHALSEPNRQASMMFAEKIGKLHWTSAAVDRLVAAEAATIERRLRASIPNACADMKAWAASGYRTLSAESKAFLHEREVIDRRVIRGSARMARSIIPADPLAREMQRYGKALLLKIHALDREVIAAFGVIGVHYKLLTRELGFHFAAVERREAKSAPPNVIVFARRRTITGDRYRVALWRDVSGSSPPGERPCRLSVVIRDSKGSPAGACLSRRSQPPEQSVNCNEGVLTVSAVTLPAARRVRLRLSEGRQITSRVIRVPAGLGGSATDAGLYFQEVRGPKPIPLSVEELGAKGRVLKVLELPRIVECKVHALKFLRDGIQPLAHGRLPIAGARRFTVQGEAYRFLGRIHFALQVSVENEGGGGESLGSHVPKLLDYGIWRSCQPHPYAIVYGVLYSRNDAVFASTPAGKVRLRTATIPRHLHAHGGVLVYGAFRSVPSALVVTDNAGKTLMLESLRRESRDARETCEGESEGPER